MFVIIVNSHNRPLPPPGKVYISNADFSSRELRFNWSPVAPAECPTVQYNILASNCGNCPTTTNHTTVTCIDIPMNGSVCKFSVETVVCGNVVGNESDPVIIRSALEGVTFTMYTSSHKG